MKTGSRLAIFDTFKTKEGDLTGEAKRQRAIITILASSANPAERTRTGISKNIAKRHNISWKNIYSGIFRDLDEILLPTGIAEEDGRLPLKRGPKALQEKGIPFYHLTKKGVLVALSIGEIKGKDQLVRQFLAQSESSEREFEKTLLSLLETSPNFIHSIFRRYVEAFCNNKFELLPFDLSKLRDIRDESLIIQKEILEASIRLTKQDKDNALKFLDHITPDAGS